MRTDRRQGGSRGNCPGTRGPTGVPMTRRVSTKGRLGLGLVLVSPALPKGEPFAPEDQMGEPFAPHVWWQNGRPDKQLRSQIACFNWRTECLNDELRLTFGTTKNGAIGAWARALNT